MARLVERFLFFLFKFHAVEKSATHFEMCGDTTVYSDQKIFLFFFYFP